MFWPEHYVGSWKIFGFVGIEMSLVSLLAIVSGAGGVRGEHCTLGNMGAEWGHSLQCSAQL